MSRRIELNLIPPPSPPRRQPALTAAQPISIHQHAVIHSST